ncbi:hypothetical protein REPUB_Repub05bG0080500 [Reevesia pubescens]
MTLFCCCLFLKQVLHPSALNMFEQIVAASKGKQIVMFLDYDGTVSPIVEDPNQAFMPRERSLLMLDVIVLFESPQFMLHFLEVSIVIKAATDFQVYKEIVGLSGLDFAYEDNTAVYHTKIVGEKYKRLIQHYKFAATVSSSKKQTNWCDDGISKSKSQD